MDDYLFSGLKVLDVATVIAAPAAAMMLAAVKKAENKYSPFFTCF